MASPLNLIVHTSHPTYGYAIEAWGTKIVWAPEFLKFPHWAKRGSYARQSLQSPQHKNVWESSSWSPWELFTSLAQN
jgi:hypothetical protein